MTRSFTFFKVNNFMDPTIYIYNPSCNNSVPLQFSPCCTYLNEINLNNLDYIESNYTYFGHDNVYWYQASKIGYGPGNTIEDGVFVYLIYGSSCILTPPFHNVGSGKLIVRNVDCPPNRTAKNNIESDEQNERNYSKSKVNFDVLDSVLIYPNPILNENFNLYVRSPSKQKATAIVINAIGQKIFEIEIRLNEINNIDLEVSSGLYYIAIYIGNKIQRRSLIKM